jgi:hypothetical protein
MSYLSTWKSAIPAAQQQWITKILQQQQDAGTLSSTDLQAALQVLLKVLASGDTRTLAQFYAPQEGQVIDSEGYNLMLQGIAGDLKAAFAEAVNLGQLHQVYQQLYTDKILAELRAALVSLETDINRLYYLNNNSQGFNQIQLGDFTKAGYRTGRNTDVVSQLFVDPRSGLQIPANQDCTVDLRSCSLTLPLQVSQVNAVTTAELSSISLVDSLGAIPVGNSRLSNLIDQQPNTYWVHQEFGTKADSQGLNIELTLDQGSFRYFSFIEIQPVSEYPAILTGLAFENTKQERMAIPVAVTDPIWQPLVKPVRCYFPVQRGRKVFLSFRQESYTYNTANNLTDSPAPTIATLVENPVAPPFPDNSFLKNDYDRFVYTIGFDNILIGSTSYLTRGIFVSPKLTVEHCGIIGLEVKEQDVDNNGSLEYYLCKQDYNASGNLLRSQVVPILPMDAQEITHEALVFNTASGSSPNGRTQLCFPLSESSPDLEIRTDIQQLSTDKYSLSWLDNGAVQVEVTNYNLNYFYTAAYTPYQLLSTQPVYFGNYQELWCAGSNLLHCAAKISTQVIASSDLYLIAIIRGNHYQLQTTPRLLEYRLLAGSTEVSS